MNVFVRCHVRSLWFVSKEDLRTESKIADGDRCQMLNLFSPALWLEESSECSPIEHLDWWPHACIDERMDWENASANRQRRARERSAKHRALVGNRRLVDATRGVTTGDNGQKPSIKVIRFIDCVVSFVSSEEYEERPIGYFVSFLQSR